MQTVVTRRPLLRRALVSQLQESDHSALPDRPLRLGRISDMPGPVLVCLGYGPVRAVLCRAVPCCAVLCRAVPYRAVLCSAAVWI